MDYETAKQVRTRLETELDQATASYPAGSGSGAMGLTPDHIKRTPGWQAAHTATRRAHERLRRHNMAMCKAFKAEMRAERIAVRAQRQLDMLDLI